MIKLLAADENFDNTIIRGLLRREPDVDIIIILKCGTAQDLAGQVYYLPL